MSIPIWNVWLADIDAQERLEALVYIGCAAVDEVVPLTATDAKRILIADATLKAHEARYLTTDSRLLAFSAVPGRARGTRTLHRTTLPTLSSLSPPNLLFENFPGLRAKSPVDVQALPLANLLDAAGLPAAGRSVMRLDLAGGVAELVASLEILAPDRLVDHLLLRIPAPNLYQDSLDPNALHQTLNRFDYCLMAEKEEGPGFHEFWFRRDPQGVRLAQLETALSELQAQYEGAQEDAKTLTRTREELGIALRLQALARHDVEELRVRYERVLSEKRSLEDLLQEVTAKLQVASRHLHGLDAEEGSSPPLASTESEYKRPAAKKPSARDENSSS